MNRIKEEGEGRKEKRKNKMYHRLESVVQTIDLKKMDN